MTRRSSELFQIIVENLRSEKYRYSPFELTLSLKDIPSFSERQSI